MNAASYETIMSDRSHPANRAGPREGVATGFVVFFLAMVFWFQTDFAWLDFYPKTAITLALAAIAAFAVGRFFGRMGLRRKEKQEALYRKNQKAETLRKIAEMKLEAKE